MSALGLALLTWVALHTGAPWWLRTVLAVPALMYAPGLGWARYLLARRRGIDATPGPDDRAPVTGLQLSIDAAWIAMAWTWISVAVVRELGLRGPDAATGLLALGAAFGLLGELLGRGGRTAPTPRRELLGAGAVLLAVILSATWRSADLVRPLDGYWWLQGADEEGHEALPIAAAQGWAEASPLGWPEAGAERLDLPPAQGPVHGTLVATGPAHGRLVLAVRGPLGSHVAVQDPQGTVVEATVQASVQEAGEDAPVRRYLDRGTAGLAVQVDLAPGQSLPVEVQGDSLYVFPGTEAVWAAHAVGELRYTHYWQILNQVENLDWAAEVLDWRWFTLHQPPGWSPLLATTLLFGGHDLPSGNILFLWVIGLVGLTGVRLASLLGRGAPLPAWLVPAGLVAVHAMLMFEPASTNFPDSLYAAAVLAVAAAVAGGRPGWFAALGIAAGLLRWPGVVLSSILVLAWWLSGHERPWRNLATLWGLVLAGGAGAAALYLLGGLPDLPFILYFETFPEHWHGQYALPALVARLPEFYWIWLRYTGGALSLALLGCLGPGSPARRGARALVGAALAYSLLLSSIDHHPSHYFLPLVALSGPALVAASAASRNRVLAWALPLLCLAGLWTTLQIAQVF